MDPNRSRTKEEIRTTALKAEAYYYDHIKDQLTEADKGRYVAIDCNTGEWEIDDTDASVERLRTRVPGALIHVIRHIVIVSEYFGAAPIELTRELHETSMLHQLADDSEEFGR